MLLGVGDHLHRIEHRDCKFALIVISAVIVISK